MEPVQILHLEDSQLDAELVGRALRRALIEAQVQRAASRREFLQALAEKDFDLILADYQLPDYDGMTALRHVRNEVSPHLPFVFVSGVLGEEIAIESLKNGATDYVLKRNLERLGPAITRALQEQEDRRKRRTAEDALKETEGRFEAMADAAPVMIWVTGANNECQFFNRSWLAFTGRSLDQELAGWTESIHAEDGQRWRELFERHSNTRRPFTTELRLRRHDGEFRWLAISGSPRFSASGEFLGTIGSCLDLTDLKQTEEKLRHVAKLESLGILAGGIAHDFNNLLTGIIGHAELLTDQLSGRDSELSLVQHISQAANAAAQLTRQMLAYSGRGHFVIEQVNLSTLVQQNRALIDAAISKNISLDFQLEQSLPLINVDPGQIQQVVMNLIINASEATESSKGTVLVKTYTRSVRSRDVENNLTGDSVHPGSYVVLEVADSGEGMDSATQSRIFDPFFTTKFAGRGLGLAAVLGIVRGHKGAIQLHSERGKGSTFTVLFPQARAQSAAGAAAAEGNDGAMEASILVIDDSPLVLSAVRLRLSRHGFHVITADNGLTALQKLRQTHHTIDLVLLDMTMPVLSGQETLAQIHSLYPDLPVVGMSGFSETEAIPQFGESLNGFIQKPFIGNQLVTIIRSVLAARKSVPMRCE